MPAGFGNGLETVEQGAQGREGVLGQNLRRPSKKQLVIGGASGGLEEGEGEEEGVGRGVFVLFWFWVGVGV